MNNSFAYRVALVDDHPIFMHGLQVLLNHKFPNVSITGSYTNAVRMLEDIPNNTPEIIFMDIEMKDMNGIQATQQALKLFPDIKVVALTQYFDGKIASEMFSAGAFGFMTKTQVMDDLQTVFTRIEIGEKYVPVEVAMELALYSINGKVFEPITEKDKYSNRELQIINLIIDGKTDKEIGQSIGISPKTVDKDKRNIMKIMGVNKATQIVAMAFKLGLVSS